MSGSPLDRPRGCPVLAWLVIVAVVVFVAVRHRADDPASRHALLLLQGRFLVGVAHLGWPGLTPGKVFQQNREALEQGPADQRLRFAVVVGELAGPTEAGKQLTPLADEGEPDERDLAELLRRHYAGRPLSAAQQAELEHRLGWFADLALTSKDGDPAGRARILAAARRTTLAQLGQVLALLVGALVGVAVLVVLLILVQAGRLGGGLRAGGNGAIYAETFAVYLVLFLGLSYAAHRVLTAPLLVLNGAVMLASLAALLWPVLRGVPWGQVRSDLGLHAGRRPGLEPLFGLTCYLATLPLVLGAGIVTFAAAALWRRLGGAEPPTPSHPLLGLALHGDAWFWLQAALVACVLAPLVEETMFRGALYRHLREILPGGAWGIAAAAAASGLLFAVVHPQGVLGVPILASLAVGFALAREWRGTLLPAMVAHGFNNAVVTLTMFLALA